MHRFCVNGKQQYLIGDTSSNGGFPISMLVYQRVIPKPEMISFFLFRVIPGSWSTIIWGDQPACWSLWFAQIYVASIIHFFFWTHSLHCNYALGKQLNNMKSKHGHIQNFCYSKTLNAPFHLQKQKNNCNWGRLQRRVLRRRSDCGLCETPIGTSPATSVRRFCWVGFVSLTQSSFEAPCHTYSSIYMTIYTCV